MPSAATLETPVSPVTVTRGNGPIVLGMPHTGTWLPEKILSKLNANGKKLADTDWHIDRLYTDLLSDVTIVKANFHRYVIDANRAPSGISLYPGQNTTGLCPVTDFDNQPIYKDGCEPDEAEIESRRQNFHAAYHAALQNELQRIRDIYGTAILYDCHSIRSTIPFLFDGLLPEFNIGTNNGETCDSVIEKSVWDICNSASGYSTVLNARFKGGWTTRHYGQPQNNIHAIQMELAQRTHLREENSPYDYDKEKAEALRPYLKDILVKLTELVQTKLLVS
ncbi:N-formylglutamate deformylase [Kiloniella sp. EL199]|uniref:N-formylglutamate deformylase n=1 Tax=Kiloniella sp. EL199 TaxID=2107581 RepID=UPI000EA05210|nr:N-formylglutamate deformylase [Kiloniella sp. EL199]